MLTKTAFQFLLAQTIVNELNGLILNSNASINLQRYGSDLVDGYWVPGSLIFTVDNSREDSSLSKTVAQAFKAELQYNFNTNSINFSIGCLPFQTYRGWINLNDAKIIVGNLNDRSVRNLNDMLKIFLGHFSDDRLTTWLIKNLTVIADHEIFNHDDFNDGLNHFTQMPTNKLYQEDTCRIHNQMMYIIAYVDSLSVGYEFIKAFLAHRKNKIVIDKLMNK